MRLLIVTSFFLMCNIGFAQRVEILFASDRYDLTEVEKKKLVSAADIIIDRYNQKVLAIYGYTDQEGSKLYNNKLSENRAKAVQRYLQLQGVDNVIYIMGKGESEMAEYTEEDKANHRKVIVDLDYKPTNVALQKLKAPTQVFTINPSRENIITCKGGTQILIPKNAFKSLYGYSAEIRVDECLKKKDFIAHGLCTQTTSGALLESKGMIKIEAFQYDRKLELRDDQEIQILFPDRRKADQTTTFYGVPNDNKVTWVKKKDSLSLGEKVQWEKYRGDKIISKGYYTFEEENGAVYKVFYAENALGEKTRNQLIYKGTPRFNALAISASKLNWINCDRFVNSGEPLVDLQVKIDYGNDFHVVLVLEDYNAIMSVAHTVDDQYLFKNIPQNTRYTVLALYQNDLMENVLMGIKRGRMTSTKTDKVVVEEKTEEQVQAYLSLL